MLGVLFCIRVLVTEDAYIARAFPTAIDEGRTSLQVYRIQTMTLT